MQARKLDPAPFIVGHSRSGTTLLRLMLDAHPRLAIPPETQFIPQLIDASKRPGSAAENVIEELVNHRRFGDFGFTSKEIRENFEKIEPFDLTEALRYFYRTYAERQGKTRWGDKSPGYGWTMQRVDRVIPEARFIHLIRDGRDATLSLLAKHDNAPPPEHQARHWKVRVKKTRRMGSIVRHYTELRYEDLITNTESELRRICDFISLDFDPVMLRYYERAEERLAEIKRDMGPGTELTADRSRGSVKAERRVAVHKLTAEPPRTDRIGVWRTEMKPDDLEVFEREAGALLVELGYELGSSARLPAPSPIAEK